MTISEAAAPAPKFRSSRAAVAFAGVCLIGVLSLLPYLKLSAQAGHEVIGRKT